MREAIVNNEQNLETLFRNLAIVDTLSTEAWEIADENGDGHINADELQSILVVLWEMLGNEKVDKQLVHEQIAAHDANGDGELGPAEFKNLYSHFLCRLYFKPIEVERQATGKVKKQR